MPFPPFPAVSAAQAASSIPCAAAVLVLAADGTVQLLSPAAEFLWGLPAAAVLGRHPAQVQPAVLPTALLAALSPARAPVPESPTFWLPHTRQRVRLCREPAADGLLWVYWYPVPQGAAAGAAPRPADQQLPPASAYRADWLARTTDAFYELDAHFCFTYVNSRAAQLWGRDPHALLGQPFASVFADLGGRDSAHQHREAQRRGQPVHYETASPILGAWLAVSIYPRPQGHLAVFFHDITARKRRELSQAFLAELNEEFAPLLGTEQLLARVSAQLAAYLHLSCIHLAAVDPDADRVDVLFDWRAAPDRPPALFGGPRLFDHLTAAGRQHFGAGRPLVLSGPEPSPLLNSPPTLLAELGGGAWVGMPHLVDGHWRFLLTVGRAEPGEWGAEEVELLQQLASHLYARLACAQAADALQASEATLVAVFEALPVGVGVVDAQGTVVVANGLMRRYLPTGVIPSRDEAQARRWRAYDANGHRLAPTEFPGPRARRGELVVPGIEMRYTPSDDTEVWTQVLAVPLRDRTGQLSGNVTVVVDVTEPKRTAEVLRHAQEQARLLAAVQAAQEDERKRIAENLHNGLGQLLYATKLRLDQLPPPPLGADPAGRLAYREANELLAESIRQTRALSHELVPLTLEQFGLAAALQDTARKRSTSALRFTCQVLLDEDAAPLPPALQLALYRLVQELTLNVVQHARGATQASVELETTPGWVLLRIEDNGPGFGGPLLSDGELVLPRLHAQVALLGGQMEIGTTDGAYVRLRLPVPILPPA